MNASAISIKNLDKRYGAQLVLDQLNWEIESGDIVALLGKNGAGKSTLLETIMNLRYPESGNIEIWGRNWTELADTSRQEIAFVPQEIKGFEWMNVITFLEYLGGFFSHWDKQYSLQLVQRWGLTANRKISELSGGQRQILHVIQALSSRPKLLILDEPVAHLDPSMRRQFLSELIELSCENQSSVVFSSHIISDLERVANKVALLSDGKINHYHDLEQLKSSIAHLKIRGQGPLESVEFPYLSRWQQQNDGATAKIVTPLSESDRSHLNGAPITLESMPMSLEDWYLEVSHASND